MIQEGQHRCLEIDRHRRRCGEHLVIRMDCIIRSRNDAHPLLRHLFGKVNSFA
jgi:hypothetical protein